MLFNWWLALPVLVDPDGMFDRLLSDATATGSSNAVALRVMEGAGALLLLAALIGRGPLDSHGVVRRDWLAAIALVVFEFSNAVFVEACQSGTDRVCFDRELRLDLPWPHYLHIIGGALEWLAALAVAWFGWRRLRPDRRSRIYAALLWYAPIVLVPLAVTFVIHRWFAVVEVTVYLAFSVLLVLTVTEAGPGSS